MLEIKDDEDVDVVEVLVVLTRLEEVEEMTGGVVVEVLLDCRDVDVVVGSGNGPG